MKKLIVFTAPGCAPCKTYKESTIAPLKEEGYNIEVIDCSEEPLIARQYAVRSVPASFVVINDVVQESFVGIKNKQDVVQLLS